ncbi:MAG: hypothetical protein R2856_31645 [Caldilineaceae bacterium]
MTSLVLAACGGGDEEPTPTPAPTATVTPLPATDTPAPTDTPSPTETPAPTETPVPAAEDSPLPTPDDRGAVDSPLPTPESDMQEDTSAPSVDPLALLIEAAKANLAESEGVALDTVSLVRVELAEWDDASLGCPDPSMSYAQVLTPGFMIVLTTGDTQYFMRTTMDPEGPIVYCGEPVEEE